MRKLGHRDRLINVLIIAFVIGVGLAVWYLPPAISYWQSSEVYKRYKDVEGVRATYVKDYRVNDTLTIGVTLLEATDSAGWVNLLQDFKVSTDMLQYARKNPSFDVWVRSVPKDNSTKLSDPSTSRGSVDFNLDLMAVSMVKREICIFHTQKQGDNDALFYHKIESNLVE